MKRGETILRTRATCVMTNLGAVLGRDGVVVRAADLDDDGVELVGAQLAVAVRVDLVELAVRLVQKVGRVEERAHLS